MPDSAGVFEPDEVLLRAAWPTKYPPLWWHDDGTLSSAAFLDAKGCSVDHVGDRATNDAVKEMHRKFRGPILGLSAGTCYARDIWIQKCPSKSNPYHAELWRSSSEILLAEDQADWLAAHAVIMPLCCLKVNVS